MLVFAKNLSIDGVRVEAGTPVPDDILKGTLESLTRMKYVVETDECCDEETCDHETEEEAEEVSEEEAVSDVTLVSDLVSVPVAAALNAVGINTVGEAKDHFHRCGTFTNITGVGGKSSDKLFTLLFGD